MVQMVNVIVPTIYAPGQWLWLSWYSRSYRQQRSVVRILSLAKNILSNVYYQQQLYWTNFAPTAILPCHTRNYLRADRDLACLYFYAANYTATAAKDYCNNNVARLPVIKSVRENTIVATLTVCTNTIFQWLKLKADDQCEQMLK